MNVTALIPFKNGGNTAWLDEAVKSLPVPSVVLPNDGNMHTVLNRAAKKVDTEFILRFDADDIALPGMVEHLWRLAWNADVVYPAMRIVSEGLAAEFGEHPAYPFCGNRLQHMNYIPGPALIRRKTFLEVGGYRDLPALEDWDLWVRMHKAGARFKPCAEAKLLYRQHEGSRNQGFDYPELQARISPDPPDVKATFYCGATPATTYVRCQLPARALPGIVRPDITVAENEAGDVLFPEHHGDAAVFQFAGNKTLALVSGNMKVQGTRVLVEVDDNYLINPGHKVLGRNGWDMRIGRAENTRDGHRWIVRWADGVIVTTDYLAEQYRAVNPNVYVCPNGVDPNDWPDPQKPDDGILRIVWFASQSHETDIPIVARALEWAAGQKDVQVFTVGISPNANLKYTDRWRFPFTALPWQDDLDAYRDRFQAFDIGVAPISRTPGGLGRSDLKALEYAMGAVCPVLSDVPPYSMWRDGENCLKAANSQGFLDQIKRLVRNRGEVRELAHAAREYVLTERTNTAQAYLWEEALTSEASVAHAC